MANNFDAPCSEGAPTPPPPSILLIPVFIALAIKALSHYAMPGKLGAEQVNADRSRKVRSIRNQDLIAGKTAPLFKRISGLDRRQSSRVKAGRRKAALKPAGSSPDKPLAIGAQFTPYFHPPHSEKPVQPRPSSKPKRMVR